MRMSSNLYLFDPKRPHDQIPEKPLTDIMREVHIARAEVSARIFRTVAAWVSAPFRRRKQITGAAQAAKPAVKPAGAITDQDRIAA
jgi:hypothetical protein